MRTLNLSATLMLLGTLTLGLADTSVDAQIAEIQNASAEDRVALVNAFKTTMSTLSAEDRAVAIAQFRESMQADGAELKTQTQTQTQTQARERLRVNQMEQTEDMLRGQMMNQHQTANHSMGASVTQSRGAHR
ncbi:hypothetical protein KJ877_00855 [bacterium]|nr:hypothetical protein [bacterium]MBU1989577.1 hypothetical protein [bacterium]